MKTQNSHQDRGAGLRDAAELARLTLADIKDAKENPFDYVSAVGRIEARCLRVLGGGADDEHACAVCGFVTWTDETAEAQRLHDRIMGAACRGMVVRNAEGGSSKVLECGSSKVAGTPNAQRPTPNAEGEDGKTPLARCAVAACELFDLIDRLDDAEAVKAIEVLKQRAKVSMVTRAGKKAEGSSKVLKCGSSKVEGEVRHA